uniref:Uncharacterized protein n=1 Tax=Fagus sylvatica TaxID=28930 RepID=A0A2N9IYU8_FAGSY
MVALVFFLVGLPLLTALDVGLDSITVASRPFTRFSSSSKCLTWRARASRSVLSTWNYSCHWLDGV